MASRKSRCWRPSQKAPRLTELSLCSEEDLLIFKRLHEKYNCSRFYRDQPFGKTDWTNTCSSLGSKTAQSFAREEVQIKHEPLTPVSTVGSQWQEQCPTASRSLRRESLEYTGSHTKNLYLPASLITTDTERKPAAGLPKQWEDQHQSFISPSHAKSLDLKKDRCVIDGNVEKGVPTVKAGNTESEFCLWHTTEELPSMPSSVLPSPRSRQRDAEVTARAADSLSYLGSLRGMTSCFSPTLWKSSVPQDMQKNEGRSLAMGTTSCFSPKSGKSGLPEYMKNNAGHILTMDHIQNKSLHPGRMTYNTGSSEHVSMDGILERDETPRNVVRTPTLPACTCQRWTSPSSAHADSRSVLNMLQENKNERKTAAAHVLAREVSADEIQQHSSLSYADFMAKYVHTDLTSYRARESVHQSPTNCSITVCTEAARTSNTRKGLSQTCICVAGEKTVSARCAHGQSRVAAESRRHRSAGKRTSGEKVQTKLTAYAGTIKKKKTAKTAETTAKNISEGEKDQPCGLNKHHQRTPDSLTHGSKNGEEHTVPVQNVTDVSGLKEKQREQLAAILEKCSLIGCLVLYEDGTTNTDSSLFSRPKVEGLLLHFEGKSYKLPVPQRCDGSITHWINHVLKDMLRKKDMVRVAINCKQFVISLLRDLSLGDNREPVEWQFEDPLIASWLLSPDSPPHTLHDLCRFVRLCHTKDADPHSDLKMSMLVMKTLRGRLREASLWPLFLHVEMTLSPLLAAMELQAIRVNVHTFLTFSQVLKKKLDKVEKKAYKLAGHSFCINSTQQLRQLLYEELRLDQQLPGARKVALTASTQRKSTSEATLRQLVHLHPLPAVVLEYRHMLKLKSTYIDGMLEAVDKGVLHTHWDQTSAATGRLVSSHPNLQAIPKTSTTITDYEENFIVGAEKKSCEIYAREPFIAHEGNVLLAAVSNGDAILTDFQQIELRLLAHLANDPALKDMFRSSHKSTDIFIQLTAQWLSKACEKVTHAEREQTKRVVYSILYGVGKERLAEYLKVPSSRAKDIMDSFLVSFPAIQVFTRKCVDYAQKHGYTETVMGRRRWLDGVHHKAAPVRAQAERQAVNFCVQGSAADLCKRAMVKVEQALRGRPHLSARLLMHIHDELVWELPQDQLPEMRDLVKQVMEDDSSLCQPLLPCLTVPITVSLSSGVSWAHLSPCP